ncbi:hypothetical protein BHM03_00057618 [Ensete ventricosum]|nr:hypothetical protein BHM03_00057618 [Ensete ventricosum]
MVGPWWVALFGRSVPDPTRVYLDQRPWYFKDGSSMQCLLWLKGKREMTPQRWQQQGRSSAGIDGSGRWSEQQRAVSYGGR